MVECEGLGVVKSTTGLAGEVYTNQGGAFTYHTSLTHSF